MVMTLLLALLAIAMESCGGPMFTNPAHRSAALVVLPGAEDLEYFHLPWRHIEIAKYSLRAEPPATDQLGLIVPALRDQGWTEEDPHRLAAWHDAYHSGASKPHERCSNRLWNKENEELRYSFCAPFGEGARMRVRVSRTRAHS